jgi:hypothetical protein
VGTGEREVTRDKERQIMGVTRRLLQPVVQRGALALLVLAGVQTAVRADEPAAPPAQPAQEAKPSVEVYGFGMGDAIADFKQNNPDWYDVVRPSRLPNVANQFGQDGHFYLSARQSRFGTRATIPTSNGDIKAVFEFDLFGVGKDAGLTTMRVRHAYGQWKQVGAGQTNTQFMDADVFPNTIEYWGPPGMMFVRLPQVFWQFYQEGDSNATIAIEAPGSSGDAGVFADRVELQNVRGRYPYPDFTGHYRKADKWGHVQISGVLRYIGYDDLITNDQFDLNGHVWGGGISGSGVIKATPDDTLRLQATWGKGIANYFNDAPIDVAAKSNPGNAVTPIVGEALGIFGMTAYLDHNWTREWSTAAGYSRVDFSNSDLQTANAYKSGQYASFNLLYSPAPNAMMGGEFLWGHRENKSDGFSVNDYRLQFSFKYSFSAKIIGG